MPTSTHGEPQFCQGRTPGYWKASQHFDQWPHPYYPVKTWKKPATKFKDVFYPAGPYTDKTLLQVLWTEGGPPHDVGRHVVAGLLNAARGWTPPITTDHIKAIWSSYIQYGFYEPVAGEKWYHEAIVEFILHATDGAL
jgi:hypothetical protein